MEKSKIMKLLFFSDRINVRDTTFLISFDTYYAFKNGPVAYRSLAVLNKYEELLDITPEKLKLLEKINILDKNSLVISEHDTDCISKIEMTSIDRACDIFGSFYDDELRCITHDYPELKRFRHIFEYEQSNGELIIMDDFFKNADPDDSPSISKYFSTGDPLYTNEEQLNYAKDMYYENERFRNFILMGDIKK
jgi:hypothetical protein